MSFIREFTDRPMTPLEAAAGCCAKSVLDLDARLAVLVTNDLDFVRYVCKYRPRVSQIAGKPCCRMSGIFECPAVACTGLGTAGMESQSNTLTAPGARAGDHRLARRRARRGALLRRRALPRRRAAGGAARSGGEHLDSKCACDYRISALNGIDYT